MAGLLVLVCGVGALAIVVPALTGSTALTVLTSSMEPGLPPGTLVIVRPTPVPEIEPGDIVTYQLHSGEPTLVTHRVVQRLTTADGEVLLITKGDANADPDPDPVKAVQVRGTVWYAIPWLGHVAVLVTGRTRAVVVPIIAAALFGYAAWMLVSALRDRRAKRSDAEDGAPEG
ncbi:signal peptidase I [Pseudoclavibacter chungangensis]|uniref:Signal peptidase I n=1 Tax=Pseudoclavibacter chungangensis TaxID=587635 RepID=A0A7J5C1J9_9MICO|nr:signal peptidase I [Pseudoclavibacter chungangensis]KAB1662498.1 signal peptidase I [Pseudoclavibacter chungangensis]NYJ68536.1 signal peptidase [Pseudoclavibacter chungangensis]